MRPPDLRGFAIGRRAARLAVPEVAAPPTAARAVVEQPDRRAVPRGPRELTERTVTDSAALSRRLALVAETGLARQRGELRVDRGCLAVRVVEPAR